MILMIGRKKGDAIEGDKILCQARNIIKKKHPVKGTSKHRMQSAILESRGRTPAFCQIDREISFNGTYRLD